MNILRIMMNRDDYISYRELVKPETLAREEWNILKGMDNYYKLFVKKEKIEPDFKEWFSYAHPEGNKLMATDKASLYSSMLDRLLEDTDDEDESITDIRKALVDRKWETTIADKILDVASGSGTLDDVAKMVSEWKKESELDEGGDDGFVDVSDLTGLARKTLGSSGLEFALPELRMALGPLRMGNFIIVGGRPDSGKTTFLAHNAVHMAKSMPNEPYQILWFNNEEAHDNVQMRIVQSALGVTTPELLTMDVSEPYEKTVGHKKKIAVFRDDMLSIEKIERKLESLPAPKLIIFDQLWKVHGFDSKSSNDVTRISNIFNWGRDIAKQYSPVITVHQLDGSAEGVKWVDQSHFHMSKTGIQGEADAILTIGKTNDDKEANLRFIHIPKNKLPGGPGSDPTMRNGKLIVEIDVEHARFKSLL